MTGIGFLFSRRSLEYHWDLVCNLVGRDFQVRYKGAKLGLVWAVLLPLLQLLIFSFVFRLVLSIDIARYTSFTFIGILVWNWFSASLNQAVAAIKSNPDLVAQPGFPTAALPIVSVSTTLINFLIALPLLLLILVLEDAVLNETLLLLPVVLAVQFVISLGLAYLVAAFNVTVRDIQHVLTVVLQLGFFVTPIFYDMSTVPEKYRIILLLNPMAHVIESYRSVLLYGTLPGRPLVAIGFIGIVLLMVGLWKYRQASYRFLEEL
jgi:lipopolysaccharide transport system permease protein